MSLSAPSEGHEKDARVNKSSVRKPDMPDGPNWTVLVVDDDQDIHAAIKLAVGRARFFGRQIDFKTASSAKEAEELVETFDRSRFALAFVDVVMERDTSGFE